MSKTANGHHKVKLDNTTGGFKGSSWVEGCSNLPLGPDYFIFMEENFGEKNSKIKKKTNPVGKFESHVQKS